MLVMALCLVSSAAMAQSDRGGHGRKVSAGVEISEYAQVRDWQITDLCFENNGKTLRTIEKQSFCDDERANPDPDGTCDHYSTPDYIRFDTATALPGQLTCKPESGVPGESLPDCTEGGAPAPADWNVKVYSYYLPTNCQDCTYKRKYVRTDKFTIPACSTVTSALRTL
jgi:hypothetical protein